MRKHFLLLFLMALLPLAGWAASYVAPTAKATVPYNAAAQQLVNAGIAHDGMKFYFAVAAKGADAPAFGTYDDDATAIVGKNAGDYVVYWVEAAAAPATAAAVAEAHTIEVTIPKVEDAVIVHAKNPTMVYGGATPTLDDFYVIMNNPFVGGETADDFDAPVSLPTGFDLTSAGTRQFSLTPREYTNYKVSVEEPIGILSIAQKAITITTAAFDDITYGTAVSATDFAVEPYASGMKTGDTMEGTLAFDIKQGDDVIPTTAWALLPAGDYDVYPKGLNNSNYAITFAKTTFTVNPKTLTATMVGTIAGATYDRTKQLPEVTLTDAALSKTLVEGTDYNISWVNGESTPENPETDGTFTNADTYTATITGAGNYTGTVNDKTYTIAKRALFIKTKSIERDYDGTTTAVAASEDYLTFVGLVSGDAANYNNLTVTLGEVTGKVAGRDAATYPINVAFTAGTDLGAGNALSTNYTAAGNLGSVGKLKINPLAIEIVANDDQKNYGAADDYVAGFEAAGLDDDDPGYVHLATGSALATGDAFGTYPTLTRPEGENAGTFAITPAGAVIKKGDDVVTANYDITYTPGVFTIVAGGFYIWAEDKSSVYGEDLKTLTWTYSGIPAEDAAKITIPEAAITTTATATSDCDTYTITIDADKINYTQLEPGKYDLSKVVIVPGNYVITPKKVTVTANQQGMNVGETAANIDQTAYTFGDGILDGDEDDIELSIVFATENQAVDATHPYATTEVLLTAGAINDVNLGGETSATLVGGLVFDATATAGAKAGNYTFTYVPGNLLVTAAAEAITLSGNSTNVATLNGAAGKKVNVKFANRSLKKGQWNVLVLPFATTVREVSNALGYAVVDVIDPSKGDENNVYFKIHLGAIEANTPFMVKTDATADIDMSTIGATVLGVENVVFTGKTIVKDIDTEGKTSGVAGAAGTKFYGLYAQKTLSGAKQWFMSSGVWSVKTSGTTNVGPLRAYLQLAETADPNEARVFIEEPDGTTTAIKAVEVNGLAVGTEGWYTVNGMKLNSVPTEKGVYIHNGKKVVLK